MSAAQPARSVAADLAAWVQNLAHIALHILGAGFLGIVCGVGTPIDPHDLLGL